MVVSGGEGVVSAVWTASFGGAGDGEAEEVDLV